jgi:hypothetical protein
MTTVYLATSGQYSDYRVQHVFTRREDAESYALADHVEERELHDGPVEVRDWHELVWKPGKAGDPWEQAEPRDFDGREGHAQHHWRTLDWRTPPEVVLTVTGWDLERVRKTYSEQRAMYLASQETPA